MNNIRYYIKTRYPDLADILTEYAYSQEFHDDVTRIADNDNTITRGFAAECAIDQRADGYIDNIL